jgi:hypothetical protein
MQPNANVAERQNLATKSHIDEEATPQTRGGVPSIFPALFTQAFRLGMGNQGRLVFEAFPLPSRNGGNRSCEV